MRLISQELDRLGASLKIRKRNRGQVIFKSKNSAGSFRSLSYMINKVCSAPALFSLHFRNWCKPEVLRFPSVRGPRYLGLAHGPARLSRLQGYYRHKRLSCLFSKKDEKAIVITQRDGMALLSIPKGHRPGH